MQRFRSKGMALIILLICTSLLSMMMIAFVRVSHSNYSLARRSDASLRATQHCLSGLDYVRNRLQHTRDWGQTPLGSRRLVVAEEFLRVSEEGTSPETNLVLGRVDGLEQERFEVHWLNNLPQKTEAPFPSFSRRRLNLPPKTALVVVDGLSNGTKRHLEVLLKNDLFSNSPLSAGSDLAMILGSDPEDHLNFVSPLQDQNSVRSRNRTFMPDAARMTFGAAQNSGFISGKEDVVLGGNVDVDLAAGRVLDGDGQRMRSASASALRAAETASKAGIQPSRDQRAPTLDGSQLAKPPGGSHTLPSGKYVLTGPGKMSYFTNPNADHSGTPDRIYSGAIYDNGSSSGTPGQEAVVLKDYHFIPQGEVSSDGSVTLSASKPWLTPQLSLGYEKDATMTLGKEIASSWKVNGDVTVQGNVSGNGALIAHGSGNINIQGKTQLAMSPDTGLALYADNAVRLQPPSDSLVSRSDVFDKNDFAYFSEIAHINPNPSTTAPIGQAFDFTQWVNQPADQYWKVGKDDTLDRPALNQINVIRDMGLSIPDYKTKILPNLAGYKDGTTPLGRPLTSGETDAIQAFLGRCEAESGTVTAVTIGRHVRLKEYLRSLDKEGPGGDPTWLDFNTPNPSSPGGYGQHTEDVGFIIQNLTENLVEEGLHAGDADLGATFQRIYAEWGDRELADVKLRGIAYAKDNFVSLTNRSFDLRGALASHDNAVVLHKIHKGRFFFDSDMVEKVLDMTKIPLIPINWAIE